MLHCTAAMCVNVLLRCNTVELEINTVGSHCDRKKQDQMMGVDIIHSDAFLVPMSWFFNL